MIASALLDTLESLLRLPREQGTVEFKSNLDEPADIGRYLSALANTAALDRHERAWVVWGVDDPTRRCRARTSSLSCARPRATRA
jgi:ATP-dependent DNA helicase RecG